MPVCAIDPKPSLYGLGIRLGFYIQWFGLVAMHFLDETSLSDVRLLGLLLSAAATLSLVIQIASNDVTSPIEQNDPSALQPADIYITLLLAAGIFIFLVPLYIWRCLTFCNIHWDVLRWSHDKPSPMVRFCSFALLVAVASVGTWFYVTYLPGRDWDQRCGEYGFFFGRVSLANKVYMAFNAILYLVILIVCVVLLFEAIGFYEIEVILGLRKKKRHVHRSQRQLLNLIRTISNLIVFAVLVVAVELSIQFNHLDSSPGNHVNSVSSLAQLIPLAVSAGFVVRSVALYFVTAAGDNGSDDGDDGSSGHHHHRRRRSRSSGYVTEKRTYRRSVVVDEEEGGPGPVPPPPTHRRPR